MFGSATVTDTLSVGRAHVIHRSWPITIYIVHKWNMYHGPVWTVRPLTN